MAQPRVAQPHVAQPSVAVAGSWRPEDQMGADAEILVA